MTSAVQRSEFRTADSVEDIWKGLGLPESALASLNLTGSGLGLPSSFKIGHIAQASIALSALTAALVYAERMSTSVPKVTVDLQDAVVEFKSVNLLTLDGSPLKEARSAMQVIGGLTKTSDGYIRIHDAFPNHREGAKALLGCSSEDDRAAVVEKVAKWAAIDLETTAVEQHLAMTALRSFAQWDCLPQASAIADFPILIHKVADGPPGLSEHMTNSTADKCLRALRVIEMTRVIAAPVAGRTLAAHGADVLWVTSPKLPDLPAIDRDTARGKRTVQLDVSEDDDLRTLQALLQDSDVFIQSYRPDSLARKGLSLEKLAAGSSRGIVCANLSAYGPSGPWSHRRGFDSLVQTCSGMNVSEAVHYGAGEASRILPCQVLDYASGYFLATGINAALYRKAIEGGSYEVCVSLAGTMKYLRSLGQYESITGFQCPDFDDPDQVSAEAFEDRDSDFGRMRAVKHCAKISGLAVGYEKMPKPLGSDRAEWL